MKLVSFLDLRMRKKIAIVTGGHSAEKIISRISAQTVAKHLDKDVYDTYIVDISGENWQCVIADNTYAIDKNDFSIQTNDTHINFDAAYIALHGTPGEDGKLQSFFDLLSIPYTGSNVFASAMTFNKFMCNKLLKQYGIKSANAINLFAGTDINIEKISAAISFPCFVKPNAAGSSFGISRVNKKEDLAAAIEHAFLHDNMIIIEDFVDGTEVTCGLHNSFGSIEILATTEVVSHNDFFDFNAKYKGESEEITPARIPKSENDKVEAISKEIYKILGLNGIARIDYIITSGVPYLIEVNTVPGMTEESFIPQQAAYKNISLCKLFGATLAKCMNNI